tara:strand:- start:2229 stop:2513 length:285 start_codon:yes stop_codon:yes gene_type:complete
MTLAKQAEELNYRIKREFDRAGLANQYRMDNGEPVFYVEERDGKLYLGDYNWEEPMSKEEMNEALEGGIEQAARDWINAVDLGMAELAQEGGPV